MASCDSAHRTLTTGGPDVEQHAFLARCPTTREFGFSAP
jgi:hypothetical protein